MNCGWELDREGHLRAVLGIGRHFPSTQASGLRMGELVVLHSLGHHLAIQLGSEVVPNPAGAGEENSVLLVVEAMS